MNKSKRTRNVLLSVLAITLSLTLVGCNKDDKTTVKENKATIATPIIENETSAPTVKVEATNNQSITTQADETASDSADKANTVMENDLLDLASLGFELKDNLLYYNGSLISANKVVNYTIEEDKAMFTNSDSSSIMINEVGDIEATFPIGLKLNVGAELSSFKLSYGDAAFILPTIENVTASNGWYKLTLAENIYLRFNDTTMEAYVDDVLVSFNSTLNNISTKFQDVELTTSYLKTYYVNAPSIQLSYEDGSVLTHTIGGATTFTLKNGIEVINTAKIETMMSKEMITPVEESTVATQVEDATTDTMTKEIDDLTSTVEPIVSDVSNIDAMEMTENVADVNVDVNVDVKDFNLADVTDTAFDEMGAFDAPVDTPYHIGLVGNYSFLSGDFKDTTDTSALGGRLDLVIEREITTNLSMALEFGFGANKLDDDTLYTLTPMLSVDYNFKAVNSDGIIPYVTLGVGSRISLNNDERTYFTAKAGAGLKYNITNNWMIKSGVNYTLNVTSKDVLHGIEVPVGFMYKF